jgi:histone deacetylase complex regulatory component SIN3
MTIQLLSKEDLSSDALISTEEKWSYYIDNYIQIATTEPSVGQVARDVSLKRFVQSLHMYKEKLTLYVGICPSLFRIILPQMSTQAVGLKSKFVSTRTKFSSFTIQKIFSGV